VTCRGDSLSDEELPCGFSKGCIPYKQTASGFWPHDANGGESTGPMPVENRGIAWADGPPRHSRILLHGALHRRLLCRELMQRAPNRVAAAVFCQTVGHPPENPTVMYRHSKENWVPDFMKRRSDVSMDTIEKYLHNLYEVQPDFLYSLSRVLHLELPHAMAPRPAPAHRRKSVICCRTRPIGSATISACRTVGTIT
jgi:hypothetical protein